MTSSTNAPDRSASALLRWLVFLLPFAIALGLWLVVDRETVHGRYWNALWNLGHIVLPAVLVLLAHRCFPRFADKPWWQRLLRAISIALLIGMLMEFSQGDPDYYDIANNLLGVFLGFAILLFAYHRLLSGFSLIILIAAIALLNHGLIFNVLDEWRMQRQFPVLVDFEQDLQRSRIYQGGDIQEITDENNGASRALLFSIKGEQRYEKLELIHLVPNWQDYKSLHLRVMNTEFGSLPELTVRLQDEAYFKRGKLFHDRYNQSFMLYPGWNQIDIPIEDIVDAPLERPMALDKMRYLGLFSVAANGEYQVYVDRVWLE